MEQIGRWNRMGIRYKAYYITFDSVFIYLCAMCICKPFWITKILQRCRHCKRNDSKLLSTLLISLLRTRRTHIHKCRQTRHTHTHTFTKPKKPRSKLGNIFHSNYIFIGLIATPFTKFAFNIFFSLEISSELNGYEWKCLSVNGEGNERFLRTIEMFHCSNGKFYVIELNSKA